jgi:hypothetical protein
MYAALARAVLDGTDRERAQAEVDKLREHHPRASRDELARRLIRKTALQCAAAGGLWTGPAAFFGAMPFGVDLAYQIVALNRLVLALAALYGADRSAGDRATGVAAGLTAGVSAEVLRQGIVRLLRQTLARRPGARAVTGALAGGLLGYGTAIAIGNFARELFSRRRAFGLARMVRK